MDCVHLIGAEDVQRAGNAISGAADQMQNAANSISSTFDFFERRMEDWVSRLESMHNEKM